MTLQPRIVVPQQARSYIVVGDRYVCMASAKDTGGAFSLFVSEVAPGHGPPPHVHQREDEFFYVLEGSITFTVGGKELIAGAGSFVSGPRQIKHCFQNRTDRPAKLMVQTTPGGFEDFFAAVNQPESDLGQRPSALYLKHLVETARKFGIEIDGGEFLAKLAKTAKQERRAAMTVNPTSQFFAISLYGLGELGEKSPGQ